MLANLSLPWVLAPLYNRNAAYCANRAIMDEKTVGYAVFRDGLLVAEDYNVGRSAEDLNKGWSTTKSWSTMLVGQLVTAGQVSLDDTLGGIFPNVADWEGVTDAAAKQTITLLEVLTMTAGLTSGEYNDQSTTAKVLNATRFNPELRGYFQYLSSAHLVSRVIYQASGLTPRQLAYDAGLFPALGISQHDFLWEQAGGVETSASGIWTSPRVMGKLGVLYAQNGYAAEGFPLIPASWVAASQANHLQDGDRTINPYYRGYGYQWWTDPAEKEGEAALGTAWDGHYTASGANGQYIAVYPAINTVIVLASVGNSGAASLVLQALCRHISLLDTEALSSCDQLEPGAAWSAAGALLYSRFLLSHARSFLDRLLARLSRLR